MSDDSSTPRFHQERHRPQSTSSSQNELIVACVPMRSNVNISGIARSASASGVSRLILTGNAKLISKIARDGADELSVEVRRTLAPVLLGFRAEGYRLVGLEQTSGQVVGL